MFKRFLFSSLLLILPITLFAQVPANDLCADAITVDCGDVVMGDTTMATETDEPVECGALNNGAAGGVWYNIAGTGDVITLSLCNENNFDTQIAVYSGVCNSQVCIGGNDQACGNQSEFSFTSNASTNYLVYIYGWGDSVGTYQLDVTCQTPPPTVMNDLCADAIAVFCGDSLTGTTIDATEVGEPTDLCGVSGNGSSPGVWYNFTGTGDTVTVSLCGSDFDTQLQVFEGNCFGQVCVAGNDDNFAACGAGNNSELVFESDVSTNYLIYINGFGAATGSFNLEVTCVTQASPPVNDDCEFAISALVNLDDQCTLVNPATITGGTSSNQTNGCVGTADDDVWFSFVATSAIHTIDLLNINGGLTNLVHAVYEGVDCDTLTQITCSDQNMSFTQNLTIGDSYYVRIWSFDSDPLNMTDFDLCIASYTPSPPPANDDCDGALNVVVNTDDSCQLLTSGTLLGATESEIVSACPGAGDDDVWFVFTATNAAHQVSLLNIVGDVTDLVHGVYSGPDCNNLTELYCSDANVSQPSDFIIGNTYWIRVYSFTNQPGQIVNFNVCINSFETIIVNSINNPESFLTAEELVEQVLISDFTCGEVDITFTNIAENPEGVSDISQRSWGYFNNLGTNFPLEEGIILSSGFAKSAEGPNESESSDTAPNWNGDIDIQVILDNQNGTTVPTNNATVFEFEFTTNLTQATFEYIFASEEYEDQFECDDNFRDGFAFLVKGPGIPNDSGTPFGGTNIAVIDGSDNGPISTISIHRDTFTCGSEMEGVNFFPELYLSNSQENTNEYPVNFDGLTMVLTTASIILEPNEIYTAKLVIADRGDTAFDSAVFLAGGSFDIGSTAEGADDEAPEINCPEDQVVEVNENTPYVLPDYVAEGIVVATDNCALFATIQTPAPGTEISAGTETIQFEAIDQGGNSKTCSFIIEVNEVLGVNEIDLKNQIKLFPNPGQNVTYIESPYEIKNVTISSVSGRVLIQTTSYILNIQDLATGVYFVEIDTDSGKVIKQLLVK